jgi:hypothetical protein
LEIFRIEYAGKEAGEIVAGSAVCAGMILRNILPGTNVF